MKDELAKEIYRLAQAEDEAGMKRLFIDRFAEFDEEEKGDIFVSVFLEALEEQERGHRLQKEQRVALELAIKLRAYREMLLMEEKARGGDAGDSETAK